MTKYEIFESWLADTGIEALNLRTPFGIIVVKAKDNKSVTKRRDTLADSQSLIVAEYYADKDLFIGYNITLFGDELQDKITKEIFQPVGISTFVCNWEQISVEQIVKAVELNKVGSGLVLGKGNVDDIVPRNKRFKVH